MSQEVRASGHIVLEGTDPRPHLWPKIPQRPAQGMLENDSIAGYQVNLEITYVLDDPA
ncbi:hypothetical protein BH24ACT17_BH24ACT17_17080 [soil metagenome]